MGFQYQSISSRKREIEQANSQTVVSGGSKGGARATPPGDPNSFNFMQFLGKYGKIVCWRPPGALAPPPQGNPGSATGSVGYDINSNLNGKIGLDSYYLPCLISVALICS